MARYFLDTSALAKHYHVEAGTARVDQIIENKDAELFISRLTLVETLSVFAVKVRTGAYDAAEFSRLRSLFASQISRRQFQVVRLVNPHYELARDLLVRYGPTRQIRTLDALQLSVALRLHARFPLDFFVCADQRLCHVAQLEGLAVLNPEQS